MDFGTLLHMAKKNSEHSKDASKFYRTRFEPPKKDAKEKKLSENIQKFLQKREHEEQERQREAKQKLASLLAMRDEKSKNKIRKMLKVTKSANKSVLEDSIEGEAGEHTGQDDYGYVSNTANDFYKKYIEKVKDVKEDKGFAPSRPQSLKDLSSTKERVKAAISREHEDKKSHTRQHTSTNSHNITISTKPVATISIEKYSTMKTLYDPAMEKLEEERKKREEEQKRLKHRKPLPPPMDFQALLKLAEKKQHEPVQITIEVVKKKKEPERLLTSKEKRELEERQMAKQRREREQKEGIERKTDTPVAPRMAPNGRIPKLNQPANIKPIPQTANTKNSPNSNPITSIKSNSSNRTSSPSGSIKSPINSNSNSNSNYSSKSATKPSSMPVKPKTSTPIQSSRSTTSSQSTNGVSTNVKSAKSSALKNPISGSTREFPPRDMKSIKPREFPPADVKKTRPFPPADIRRTETKKPQLQVHKRRIVDDDEEEEYDSEMDDFIDDGEEEEDYSTHIRAIFGYDKSKYRHLDDEDDRGMESNFAQVQREEYISKKIGLQEDLEDMEMEAREKKQKMLAKRKKH